MTSASIYLNFPNQTEKAFNFFKSVYGTEFICDYYGSCQDKFGVHWMFNCPEKET